MEIWSVTILAILFSIIFILDISRQRKHILESPPYGKKFIKNFEDSLERICRETEVSNSVSVIINNIALNVKAIKCKPTECLEYYTISPYECIKFYVEDELVAVMHSLNYKYDKKAKYVEFTSKRKQNEIIEIVDLAANVAKNSMRDRLDKSYSKKSFYVDNPKENKPEYNFEVGM